MTPEVFQPTSRGEAAAAYGDGRDVTVVGGGTILVPEINAGRLSPTRALLLSRSGLDTLVVDDGTIRVGATCPLTALDRAPEPLRSAAREVADQEIRGQATLGGNLCAPPGADAPRGDLRAPLVALAARVRSAGDGGERAEPVEEFLAGTAPRLVLDIEVEEPRWAGYASLRRPHAHHYTILAVSAAETSAGLRVAVAGAGPSAVRLRSVEESGDPGDAVRDVTPADDALASAAYRRRMLPVLVARALASKGGP